MGGGLGRLFREFSVTICVAILISGVVSVTLTPMLCSRFLKAHKHTPPPKDGDAAHAADTAHAGHAAHAAHGAPMKPSRFNEITEQAFDSMLNAYDRTLQIVLRHR